MKLVEQDHTKERKYQSGRDSILQSISRQVYFNQQEIKQLERMQGELLMELGYYFETIPGISTVTASALVAHIGDIKRFKDADKLANYAGAARSVIAPAERERTCRTRVWVTVTYITFCIYLPCNRYRLTETEEHVIHYCGPILNAKFHRERQRYRP